MTSSRVTQVTEIIGTAAAEWRYDVLTRSWPRSAGCLGQGTCAGPRCGRQAPLPDQRV